MQSSLVHDLSMLDLKLDALIHHERDTNPSQHTIHPLRVKKEMGNPQQTHTDAVRTCC